MAKGNKSEPREGPKSKPIKSIKPRNKEMFTELKTHEETKMRVASRKHERQPPFEMVDEEDENSYSQSIKNQDPRNVEEMCVMVHHLLSKNKISARNAFEVPLINLELLDEFSKVGESENGWKRVSSTLENDSKIYSYRVDAIHSIAYKIMNTMARNEDGQPLPKDSQSEPNPEEPREELLGKRAFPITEEIEMSTSQLEKNIDNINSVELEKGTDFNPNFERTKRQFDQSGIRGILLNNIPIDMNLELSLNQTRNIKPKGLDEEALPVKVDAMREPLEILMEIQEARKNAYSLMRKEFMPAVGYEQSWRKIKKCEFNFQEPQVYELCSMRDNEMEIEEEGGCDTFIFRKVEDVVKVRGKKKQPLKSSIDVAADGISWLSEMDKKMLGIAGPAATTPKKTSTQIKTEKNEDDIDFDPDNILEKWDVFSEETMEKAKAEQVEEIEQKHMLPLKPFNKFKVEQIMTLREEPVMAIAEFENPEDNYEMQRERDQVDLRRQQLSIRDSKEKMKKFLGRGTDFCRLFSDFEMEERGLSAELCFLTVLHLANENNLRLEQVDEYNFKIK